MRARFYLPTGLKSGAPLVVILHGCTQSAAIYDHGSGWSHLADRNGFALLFPEQQRANNMNLCFNWYQPGDASRGVGEVEIDPPDDCDDGGGNRPRPGAHLSHRPFRRRRDASAMLAAHPEMFAGGAIIAGLPFGSADTLGEALTSMNVPVNVSDRALGDAVRSASTRRPWPRISVWHGSADRLVVPGNGEAIVRQWRDVDGLPARPSLTEDIDGYPRRRWTNAAHEVVIEEYVVTGMAHGTPLMPGTDEGQSGQAGAHMLDVGLSSTDRIAAFFGIAPKPAGRAMRRDEIDARRHGTHAQPAVGGRDLIIIEKALRGAGLMR